MAYMRQRLGFIAPTGNGTPVVKAAEKSWWESIWSPTKEVLTTAAGIFSQVYPAVKGTPYPTPYPQYPGTSQFPYGMQSPQMQAGLMSPSATPAWLMPVLLGVGGFILINSMGKRGRR